MSCLPARRTAKSGIEQTQSDGGVPGDVVGGGSYRECGVGAEAVDREGGVVDGRQAGGESWPPGVVAIFVPPPIFQEVQAVFHPPVVADVPQQIRGGDAAGIEARHEIPHVVRHSFAGGGPQFTIDAQDYATAGQVECVTHVVGVVQVDPHPAGFFESPLLSVDWAAGGRSTAWAKQCTRASSASGWLPFTCNK